MARFNTASSKSVQPAGAITTTGTTKTFEGGDAFTRDAKGELFLLAAVNMVGQDTFYESAAKRDDRFTALVHEVARTDPAWLLRMTVWLRQEANMRTASIVMAAEAIKARLDDPSSGEQFLVHPKEGEAAWCGSRDFAAAAISRGDEPGEFLGYWASKYGKKFPKPVKRGVGHALLVAMSEYGYAKYGRADGSSWGWGDVAEMVHPQAGRGTVASDLIRHAINERHGRGEIRCVGVALGDGLAGTAVRCPAKGVWMDRVERGWCDKHYQEALAQTKAGALGGHGTAGDEFPVIAIPASRQIPASLTKLRNRADLLAWPQEDRRAFLGRPGSVEALSDAGITWEALSGWLGGPLDASFWEAIIPTMGYMALLRNLRNFEQAGISVTARRAVCERLSDPARVAKSRQLPFRFLSAYKAVTGDHYSSALSDALDASIGATPRFPGTTLVLVDTSASMQNVISAKSSVTHLEIGALFGCALAQRGLDQGDKVELYGFANGIFRHDLPKGGSVMKGIRSFDARVGEVGHGTETVAALKAAYNGHDRVILVTDMQAFSSGSSWGYRNAYGSTSVTDAVPASIPMYGINPGGYASTALDLSKPNRFEIGGFSDKVFSMMALLGQGNSFEYPF